MKKIAVLILITVFMAGCAATAAREPALEDIAAESGDIALGEEITDEVMGTKDRFQSFINGSWTTSDDKPQRLEVEEGGFVLYTEEDTLQGSEPPAGDWPVNVMFCADQEGNEVMLTVGNCYENAMFVSIDQDPEILFLRENAAQ